MMYIALRGSNIIQTYNLASKQRFEDILIGYANTTIRHDFDIKIAVATDDTLLVLDGYRGYIYKVSNIFSIAIISLYIYIFL